MNEFSVAIVERSELADALRGVGHTREAAVDVTTGKLPAKLQAPFVGVGYIQEREDSLPHFVVTPGSDRREFFAWVNTYCPFATPLSQWCHVVTPEDLPRIQAMMVVPAYGGAATAWAGVAIGEALLYAGSALKLSHLSVAALQSCGAFVAAKAHGLWSKKRVRSLVLDKYNRSREIVRAGERRVRGTIDYETVWMVIDAIAAASPSPRKKPLQTDLAIRASLEIARTGFVKEPTMTDVVSAIGWSRAFVEF